MSAEHPTGTAAYLDELDEFGRQVVAEAKALPPIEPKVELTEAETDELREVLIKACGALRHYERAYPHLPPCSQDVEAVLDDLRKRQSLARSRARQATTDRDRAYIDRAYQRRWQRQRDRAPQRDDGQGGGAGER